MYHLEYFTYRLVRYRTEHSTDGNFVDCLSNRSKLFVLPLLFILIHRDDIYTKYYWTYNHVSNKVLYLSYCFRFIRLYTYDWNYKTIIEGGNAHRHVLEDLESGILSPKYFDIFVFSIIQQRLKRKTLPMHVGVSRSVF